MALKLKIGNLEDVEEKHRSLYTKLEDGSFALDVEGLPDVSGFESALDKERRNGKTLRQQLKMFERNGELIDIEQYDKDTQELADLREQKEALGKSRDEQVTQAVEKLRGEFKVQFDTLTKQNEQLEADRKAAQEKLRTFTIENALESAALTQRVRKEYLDDVKLRAPLFTVIPEDEAMEGETVVMVGSDGNPSISTKAGQKHVTPVDWLEQQAREKPGWFEPSSGAGASGGPGKPPTKGAVSIDDASGILANLDNIADGKTAVQ